MPNPRALFGFGRIQGHSLDGWTFWQKHAGKLQIISLKSFSRPNSLFSKTYDQTESLIVQTLQFYSKRYPKKTVLLERFTFNTDDFNAMDLVADYEATSLARGPAWPFLKN